MLPLHAGYRRPVRCQAAFCHSPPEPFCSRRWVLSTKAGIHPLTCHSPPSPFVQGDGCSRRRNVIPECFCRGRESTSPSQAVNVPLPMQLPADPVSVDERITRLVVAWREKGRGPQLDELLILSFLREHPSIDTRAASSFLQLGIEEARSMLEVMTSATPAFLERQGRTRAATFALSKNVARELTSRVSYSKTKGIESELYEAALTHLTWR